MRHVGPPQLAELTARAQSLTSAGDLAGARQMLENVLDPVAAEDPRRADPDMALAAALHARILIALGDPHGARVWAAFAHSAEERLHGPHDERTVAAAATHAAVLQRVGNHGRAAQVYRRLVGDLSEIDGADSARVLAAEADLATAEHSAGHCTAARSRLVDAWRRHHRTYGDAAPAGIKMLARLGAMERECGRDDESRHHLRQAQAMCARYLPGDHPLVRQVSAVAAGSASGKHRCGRVEQSAGPRDAPGVQTAPFPRRPTVSPPPLDVAEPAFRPPPEIRGTEANAAGYQPPVYLSDVHRPPGELTGRHARAGTLPPALDSPMPPAPAAALALPPTSERVRPAIDDEPEPPRRRQPFLLAAVVVAAVAAAVAVVVLTLPDRNNGSVSPTPSATAGIATSQQATAPSATATTAPPGDPGAPRDVRLQDNGDSVSLRWAYPDDAERPVLVSGGRTGQKPRVFQQLPAGASEYVVYGLSDTQNYCFTVAVAYSNKNIATSSQVCTDR
ncbi:fibronectin type III domain-containing protein [Actinoplanes sp. TBRC 11911]|uniref:tetratricopeptide repeat protein n=1 Tax=Actinoplanes sp. TBRC 11911 TaxID=2729386 RepID=UPI00145CC81A|nr:tetratricopeptide repeat protein [Actinoplanes sp. TBRC 11911]NMO51143.1 fibronectin type III domain-containing protein [Actinoplanes sp. TBRC 11911]